MVYQIKIISLFIPWVRTHDVRRPTIHEVWVRYFRHTITIIVNKYVGNQSIDKNKPTLQPSLKPVTLDLKRLYNVIAN